MFHICYTFPLQINQFQFSHRLVLLQHLLRYVQNALTLKHLYKQCIEFPPDQKSKEIYYKKKKQDINLNLYFFTLFPGIRRAYRDNVKQGCADVSADRVRRTLRPVHLLPVLLQGVHQSAPHRILLLSWSSCLEPSSQVSDLLYSRSISNL